MWTLAVIWMAPPDWKTNRLRSNGSGGPWNTTDLNPPFDDQWKLIIDWLVLWNMLIHFIFFYDFPYIGNNHPNWRTHIFQRGWHHQPVDHWVVDIWGNPILDVADVIRFLDGLWAKFGRPNACTSCRGWPRRFFQATVAYCQGPSSLSSLWHFF